MNAIELRRVAEKTLSEKRFLHTKGVAQTARQLAIRHGIEGDRAEIAGWLHDLCRELGDAESVRISQQTGIVEDALLRTPVLLHGPLAALWAAERWGIDDAGIREAVRAHTLGDAVMAPLTCVLYVADGIEPNRSYPGVDLLRRAADRDLYEATEQALTASQTYLLEQGKEVHPVSVQALARVRKIRGEARK